MKLKRTNAGANWLRFMGTCSTACEGSQEATAFVTLNQKGGVALCV